MIGEQGSLVKYSTPVLISGSNRLTASNKNKKEQDNHHTEDILG
jgi:hypothetical protein